MALEGKDCQIYLLQVNGQNKEIWLAIQLKIILFLSNHFLFNGLLRKENIS